MWEIWESRKQIVYEYGVNSKMDYRQEVVIEKK